MIMGPSGDQKAAFKLAQLCEVLDHRSHGKIIEKILDREGDIDFQIPVDSPIRHSRPYYIGYTALHLAHGKTDSFNLFRNLLNRGADFTKKSKDGQTVLHMMCSEPENVTGALSGERLNSVLSAHVDSGNFSNPCNENGLSHFHIACMSSNIDAVQFFLDNGASVDEAISMDSKVSPGYTPLHFAAISSNTKVVEILLAHGANMHLTDAKGMTPLHLLIERRIRMHESIHSNDDAAFGEDFYKGLQEDIEENEKVINMLLESTSSDNDSLDSIGLSTFHVACMLQDTSAAQHLFDRVTDIDHCVNKDSQLWPGYTALHFAAHISIEAVKMLVNQGAKLELTDSQGLTPLDLCVKRYRIEDICAVLSLKKKYANISFSKGKTKLVSLIRSLANRNHFKKLMDSLLENVNVRIPMKSPVWPGCTPLHLAVMFSKTTHYMYEERDPKKEFDLQIIRLCLKNGADLSMQDSRGRTALHLAYRLNKMTVVDVMLRHCRTILNVLDDEGLSHLHIFSAACVKVRNFKKCTFESSQVNAVYRGSSLANKVRPGSTPLHASLLLAEFKDELGDVIRILLKNGADPCVKDADGLTPVHWLLNHSPSSETRQLLTAELTDCVAEKYAVSHLHVACYLDDEKAVKRLLEKGADVNLAIKCDEGDDEDKDPLWFLGCRDGYKPMHFSSRFRLDTENLLLEYGAEVLVKKATDGWLPLDDTATLDRYVSRVQDDDELGRRLRREFGWTKLHLACYSLYVDGFEDLVKAELEDINARVHSNSPVWKGYTPLHLLMHRTFNKSTSRHACIIVPYMYRGLNDDATAEKALSMSRILLENGADVTLIEEEGESPVGMLFKYSVNDKRREHAGLLMKYHKHFNANPVNAQGISQFHIACYLNDVDAVRGFLEHGVDVNRPIDYFAQWCPGYTPLHLASQLQVVELLFDHGADVHVENVIGRTALHKAFERNCFDERVIAKIIESGADINAPNIRGETPFEIAISDTEMTMEKLTFCIRKGCRINSCNPITGVGYSAMVLGTYYRDKSLQMRIVETVMNNENSTGILGRTTLHNFVTKWPTIKFEDYFMLLEKLIESGEDVDHQDNEGKTALHLSVKFENEKAVRGLLMCGADINIADVKGISALSYVFTGSTYLDPENDDMKNALIVRAYRLKILELDLSKDNTAIIVSNAQNHICQYSSNIRFAGQLNLTRSAKLGVRSICLSDFLSETGAVVTYRSLNQTERCKIDRCFETMNKDSRWNEIKGLLNLQYRKAVKRVGLLNSATNSFRFLLGFDLPDLCAENIFMHLRNSDLNNIISAGIENEDMRMDVD